VRRPLDAESGCRPFEPAAGLLATPSGLDEDEGIRRSVLGRIDCIIGAFDRADHAFTLHELTERTGLPKSTVHRMVDQLVDLGWLEREVSGYRIGMRLFEIGGLASRRSRLSDLAYPYLHALSVATGLAVQMAILDGTDVVYLERIPMRGFRLPTRQGGRQPAYCTGLGKAMLAFDEDTADEVLSQTLPERTSRTLTRPRDLAIELERIAETGLAFDHQESYEGLACAAAPLRGSGRAIAAVSVSGPVARIDLHAVAPLVRNTAAAIWNERFQRG
jgi:DNA-binding IclR family transcriptional regulator